LPGFNLPAVKLSAYALVLAHACAAMAGGPAGSNVSFAPPEQPNWLLLLLSMLPRRRQRQRQWLKPKPIAKRKAKAKAKAKTKAHAKAGTKAKSVKKPGSKK